MQASVDAEMLELATYLQDAPMADAVKLEAAGSAPNEQSNFDRDNFVQVASDNAPTAEYNVAPPVSI